MQISSVVGTKYIPTAKLESESGPANRSSSTGQIQCILWYLSNKTVEAIKFWSGQESFYGPLHALIECNFARAGQVNPAD